MELFLFLIFSISALISSFFVITAKNPIHSVLFLVLVFFNISGLLIMLGVEFLALLFLIVYVGAIAILFLFIIMMLSLKIPDHRMIIFKFLPVGLVLGLGIFFELASILNSEFSLLLVESCNLFYNQVYMNFMFNWQAEVIYISNMEIFASVLYTNFAYPFLLSGIILLISMIGAITLTLHRRIDVKRQKIYKQMQQNFSNTVIWKT